MELLELVAAVAGDSEEECPFDHCPVEHVLENDMENNSKTLSSNLATESANETELYLPHLERATLGTGSSGKKNYKLTYNAHHLIPGNASWPETELLKWIDEDEEGLVKGDIGYDVNGYQNGLDLPSANAMRGNWTVESGRSPDFQMRYAFSAMDYDPPTRQFHDSHEAYSDFVVEVMDKIAARLDKKPSRMKGCGDEDCAAGKKKPFAPPYGVLARINGVSARLAGRLYGIPGNWKKPIMTSKYSLMYKNRVLNHDQAAQELQKDSFEYKK